MVLWQICSEMTCAYITHNRLSQRVLAMYNGPLEREKAVNCYSQRQINGILMNMGWLLLSLSHVRHLTLLRENT